MERSETIGALARHAGCAVQTIRHYEQIGLLPLPGRTQGGHRVYGRAHRDRLAFIRHARELGFDVESIRALLRLADHKDTPCADADRIAAEHLSAVRDRIAKLRLLETELARMVEDCPGGSAGDCHVLEVLPDHSHAHCVTEHVAEPAATRRKSRAQR